MSHDNPDIADLSDPCRPTKLAEMFSELYDNQWTDGFAALAKYEDEKAIEKLLNILKVSTELICAFSYVQLHLHFGKVGLANHMMRSFF